MALSRMDVIAAAVALWLAIFGCDRPAFLRLTAAAASIARCSSTDYKEVYTNPGIHNGSSSTGAGSYNDHSNAREFRGHGCAAHLFVEFGAYRGGNRTFSILGLASKPLHQYGHPSFSCEWIPQAAAGDDDHIQGTVMKDLPDYGYGRAYTVVVVTCSFDSDVGTDAKGGELVLQAYHGDMLGREERIVALTEKPGQYNASVFEPPYPYDFLYCGSPLYGRVNPRRAREWIAYHDMVFGERSHFIIYDAGGVHEAVIRELLPWMQLGRVSVQDVRSTAHFDGYYYNQFLMVNDCLQRSKFLANWTFFFDLDEYIYVEPPHSLHSLMAGRYNSGPGAADAAATEVNFRQYRMVKNLCHSTPGDSTQRTSKQWGFEKLTYEDLSSTNRDVKYACNPRMVYSTGVHGVEHFEGRQERLNDSIARYYHYHGVVAMDEIDMCEELSENSDNTHNFTRRAIDSEGAGGGEESVVQYDPAMVPLAHKAKIHESRVLELSLV